jgi:thioredoxin reductase (NADPH)
MILCFSLNGIFLIFSSLPNRIKSLQRKSTMSTTSIAIKQVPSKQVAIKQVAVIGSGPAGWTAALYLARANLAPIVFEGTLDGKSPIPGGQLMTTTEIENYPGFPNGGISGPELMERMQKQAVEFGAIVRTEWVDEIRLVGAANAPSFDLVTESGTQRFDVVILATGATAKYLGLPSETTFANRGVSACATCDGAAPRFRNKTLVVVGGGDTAMEEATFLTRFASRVYIVVRRDVLRASAVMAARAQKNEKITFLFNHGVDEIVGDGKNGVTHVVVRNLLSNATQCIEAAGYFSAIGHQPNSHLVRDLVDLDAAGYVKTQGTPHTKVPGLFVCGDVMDPIYRQAITAAGTGCAAALEATRYLEKE